MAAWGHHRGTSAVSRLGISVVAALLLLASGVASATAPSLRKVPSARGWVGVRVAGPANATVILTERVGTVAVPLGRFRMPTGALLRHRLLSWRCDRRERTVIAQIVSGDGTRTTRTLVIRTPPCTHRVGLRVAPGHPRARRPFAVRVVDDFGVGGLHLRVCLRVARLRDCRSVDLPRGRRAATVSLRPPGSGECTLTMGGLRGQVTVRRRLHVRSPTGRLTLLTTGDSEIQEVQDHLAQLVRPRGVVTVRDDHVGSRLSATFPLDWPQHARAIAGTVRPEVSVVFLGGNEGFGMRTPSGATAPCCGAAWSVELARRTRGIMRRLTRGGRARVYWILLPTPRSAAAAQIFRATNRAYVIAAAGVPGVTLVDIRPRFPAGSARTSDGYHLASSGNRSLARLLYGQLSRDGLL